LTCCVHRAKRLVTEPVLYPEIARSCEDFFAATSLISNGCTRAAFVSAIARPLWQVAHACVSLLSCIIGLLAAQVFAYRSWELAPGSSVANGAATTPSLKSMRFWTRRQNRGSV